jgi:hypothetical protein
MQKSVNFYVFAKPIYFSFAKYIVIGGTQSCLAKCKVHSIKLQSRWWNRALVQKKKTKRQRTWDKLPGWIKKTSDSSRAHKIYTRDGSVIDSDLTYKFGNMDRSSHGVFVSKYQTKVTYPLQPHAREPASPPLYFRSQSCQPPRIANPIT